MLEKYHTLEDFLIQNRLSVDGVVNDAWGELFPVKGIEFDAAILIADISNFSERTAALSPTETLIFINNFLAWITAESIRHYPCIIERYVGDAVMVVFSEEFGSKDPIADALQAAKRVGQDDAWAYSPHMGIAFGRVIAGFTGTKTRFGCSVFGRTVTLASRLASTHPIESCASSIAYVANLTGEEVLRSVFGSDAEGNSVYPPQNKWRLLEKRAVLLDKVGEVEIREAIKVAFWIPSQSAEDRARENLRGLRVHEANP